MRTSSIGTYWSLLRSSRLLKHQLKCNFISQAVQSWPLLKAFLFLQLFMIIIIGMNPLEHCLLCNIETTLTCYNFCTFADWDHIYIYIYIYFKSVPIKCFSSILICKCSNSVHIASDMYVNGTNTCSRIFFPQDIYIYIYFKCILTENF